MVKVTKSDAKILAPLFLLMAIFLVSIFYSFNRAENLDIRSLASVEDDVKYCVNAPDCCAAISKTHDAHECDWPIRGYCKNCGDIEGKNERCGWYWIFHGGNTDSPEGYGCMIGSEGSMRPKYNSDGSLNIAPTAVPTVPVQPTAVPTSISTPIPINPTEVQLPTLPPPPPVQPTQVIEPSLPRQITYIPVIIPPYTPPTVTPTPTPFKFNLPNIFPPKEKVQSFWEGIRLNLLNFFSKVLP